MTNRSQADTETTPIHPTPDPRPTLVASTEVRVDVSGLSDKGKVRANNEDHYLILCFGRFLETLRTNLPEDELPVTSQEIGYGMAVADGMGGHAAGEVASRLALRTLIHCVLELPDWILIPNEMVMGEVVRRAADRLQKIHEVLTSKSRSEPELYRMGTTLTTAASIGKELVITHVGDSRAYRFRQGMLAPFTKDHTVAQAMADQGYISQDDVHHSRLRHMLTQTLGGGAASVQPDVQRHQLEDGDCLLLCTDGLTEMVDEATIAGVLASGDAADVTCHRLVDLALEHGGKDNVTVVVARYQIPSPHHTEKREEMS
jgi:protein phosphatase